MTEFVEKEGFFEDKNPFLNSLSGSTVPVKHP